MTTAQMTIACRSLRPDDAPDLLRFFEALSRSGSDRLFHPHPFTAAWAERICRHRDTVGDAHDEYHAAFADPADGEELVAYGMLRGWAEGYEVPSLGIAVHPLHRGRGIARRFMDHLHDVAASRAAHRVRLKVYRDNDPARSLYESLGYRLEPHSDVELIGFRDITRKALSPC
jgi:ribosomal-protein-alanine N-acetyltransferase